MRARNEEGKRSLNFAEILVARLTVECWVIVPVHDRYTSMLAQVWRAHA
jgi:endonuclease YncB( thermonuclease family)